MPRKKTYKGVDIDYNVIIVRNLLDWIQDTGDIDLACKNNSVDRTLFEGWLKKYKDFKAKVLVAQQYYRDSLPLAQKMQARKALLDYLYGKQTRTQKVVEKYYDEEGKVSGKKVVEKVDSIEVPRWAIERALGSTVSELDALRLLIDSGWIDEGVLESVSDRLNLATDDIKKILVRSSSPKNKKLPTAK